MTDAGFDIKPGVHPIVPVMLYDAKLAQEFAAKMLEEGIYVIGFYYPVVDRAKQEFVFSCLPPMNNTIWIRR